MLKSLLLMSGLTPEERGAKTTRSSGDNSPSPSFRGKTKAECKKLVAEYSEPHRSAKEEMEHFFENFDLPTCMIGCLIEILKSMR